MNPFRCTTQWFLGYSQSCATVTSVKFQNIPSLQKEAPSQLVVTPHLPRLPSSRHPLTHFLSLDLPVLDLSYERNRTIYESMQLCSHYRNPLGLAHSEMIMCFSLPPPNFGNKPTERSQVQYEAHSPTEGRC